MLIQNPVGYLPTVLVLDVVTGVNVLAAFVDGGLTTGWWYEGSGLIRSARLVVTSADVAIAPFGVASPSFAQGAITPKGPKTSAGLTAASAVVTPSVELVGPASAKAKVNFTLIDADGAVVAAWSGATMAAPASGPTLSFANAELWSVARPYLYTLAVSVYARDGAAVDSVEVSIGIRNLDWDAEQGLKVNEQRVKMRGACNHESFTGVGASIFHLSH